jgi:SpoVK/Ycf46/Vps4 family AAA+-type ATPase
LSSIVLAHDIHVKFEEIGALDDIKRTLKDLIILPLQRPDLFRRGNLRKVRQWKEFAEWQMINRVGW